ncbi:MAG TPA: CsgG/HfaB family protein [Kiritimatiellia bacterium]|nr:CsgG/HfaB family protein [Kiritimatiellia bacterium]HNS81330.1 CsgG/HfaB family protein [Kiritimatiellia bacterium]HPA78026.1 CsgG/HfaB family protein [Kiritimatiellia bacterium]HQQ04126.1 CsgG/HfaB family protein [Kiritimatiellia bacterium]
MKRKLLVVSFLSLSVALTAVPSFALWGKAETKTSDSDAQMNLGEYKGLKHAIGCKDFDNEAGWHGEWQLGENLSIMLESALYDTGRFVLVEREKLKDVIAEQDLVSSGRAAQTKKIAQTGKIRPAKYLASGAVTTVEDNQSGGHGGISIKGISVGMKKNEAQITIIAKLIDTTTSEIVAKKSITGKAGGTGLDLGVYKGGVGVDLGGFKKTPIGQAAQDCINQAAKFFATAMEEFPFEGSVIKVSGSQVIINRGSEFGVETGQELVMSEEGETLIDPDTGAILGQEDGKVIGKIRVAKVNEKISYCDIVSGEKNPATGTLVRAE